MAQVVLVAETGDRIAAVASGAARKKLDAFASELAIGSVAPAHIGEALQLDHGVGISLQRPSDVVQLVDAFILELCFVEVEIDRLLLQW